MRSSWKILASAAATLVAAPQLALADDVEAQLQQMQDRMAELESKLEATNDDLENSKVRVEQQQQLIEKAGLDESRGAGSGLAEFLNMVEVDGFVAASYNWNFNMLKDENQAQTTAFGDLAPSTVMGENNGAIGMTAIGNANANSFQLDQLWFGIGKKATMESNAGFRADIVYGAMADANREGTYFTTFEDDFGADDTGTGDLPHLFQAYAEYLAPVGENGISFKGGRFATLIGAESFRQDQNFNITRGANWALQPVNHTGLLMSGKCNSCGMDWSLGVVNSYSDTMSDRDNEKGVIGGVKWTGETLSFAGNMFYGGDAGDFTPYLFTTGGTGVGAGIDRSGDKIGVADAILWWNPSDKLSAWVNYDYFWVNNANSDMSGIDIHAISLASRYAITDATGVALRGEYQHWNDFVNQLTGETSRLNWWTITGTVDHALTENLIVKVEARYDVGKIKNGSDEIFFHDGGNDNAWDDNDQVLGLIQMMYKF